MTKYKVTIEYDQSPSSPLEDSGFEMFSFSTKHSNFKHPDEFDVDEINAKLKSGHAFILSYFEHGNCIWSLQGTGPQCQWDNVDRAGILILDDEWNEDYDYEKRSEVASNFLKTYTAWCNGEVYGFIIEKGTVCEHCGHIEYEEIEDGSLWGLYDDYIIEAIHEVIEFEADDEIILAGNTKDMIDAEDIKRKEK